MTTLTSRQTKLLQFILAHIDEHGYQPNYREISDYMGNTFPSIIGRMVAQLQDYGWLGEVKGHRAITIPESTRQWWRGMR